MNHRILNPEEYEAVSAYYDGEHPDPRDMERRLAEDPALAACLETLRGLSRRLHALPDPRVADGFAERVAEQAAAQPNRVASPPLWRRIALPLAAAGLLVIAGGILLRNHAPATSQVQQHATPEMAAALENLPEDDLLAWVDESEDSAAETATDLPEWMPVDVSAEWEGWDNSAADEGDEYDQALAALDMTDQLSDEDAVAILQLLG